MSRIATKEADFANNEFGVVCKVFVGGLHYQQGLQHRLSWVFSTVGANSDKMWSPEDMAVIKAQTSNQAFTRSHSSAAHHVALTLLSSELRSLNLYSLKDHLACKLNNVPQARLAC